MAHPNAYAATVTTAVATFAVWLAAKLGYHLNTEQAALIAGGTSAAVLYIGRRGIKGTAQALWKGGLVTWTGARKK